MNVWKQENYELCRFLNLPYNLQICSKCVFSNIPRETAVEFEKTRKKKEECQGNGIYRGKFKCK